MVVRADFVLVDQISVKIVQLSVTLLHGCPTEGKRENQRENMEKRMFGPKVKQSSYQKFMEVRS